MEASIATAALALLLFGAFERIASLDRRRPRN
jgi:hypothetical protein